MECLSFKIMETRPQKNNMYRPATFCISLDVDTETIMGGKSRKILDGTWEQMYPIIPQVINADLQERFTK
jgi:hypothetical protein